MTKEKTQRTCPRNRQFQEFLPTQTEQFGQGFWWCKVKRGDLSSKDIQSSNWNWSYVYGPPSKCDKNKSQTQISTHRDDKRVPKDLKTHLRKFQRTWFSFWLVAKKDSISKVSLVSIYRFDQ